MTEPVPAAVDPDIDGVDAWLDANWDPQLTVRDWWARLARAGLAHSMLRSRRRRHREFLSTKSGCHRLC